MFVQGTEYSVFTLIRYDNIQCLSSTRIFVKSAPVQPLFCLLNLSFTHNNPPGSRLPFIYSSFLPALLLSLFMDVYVLTPMKVEPEKICEEEFVGMKKGQKSTPSDKDDSKPGKVRLIEPRRSLYAI